jgi:histidine triad (HIT) family protein
VTGRVRRRHSSPDCVFCRIVAGKAAASKVFENGRVLALMDANPVRRGHVLVIPKAHRAQIWAMTDAEFAAVYRTLPTLVRALARATGADAVNILSLNGPAGGQTVFHLHFHLIPIHGARSPLRRKGRRITLKFVQQAASRAALDRIARRIRGHLAGARSPGGESPL